jgi:hypothetical protein
MICTNNSISIALIDRAEINMQDICKEIHWDDTQRDPKGHYLYQRAKQVGALSSISESRRIQHFLDHDLADANRAARQATRIGTNDEPLRETLLRSSERLERMSLVLDNLQKTMGDGPRSAAPRRRANRVARKRQ